MIKVLSFLSNENCFAGHFRGPCGPRFEHHCFTVYTYTVGCVCVLGFDCFIFCLFMYDLVFLFCFLFVYL